MYFSCITLGPSAEGPWCRDVAAVGKKHNSSSMHKQSSQLHPFQRPFRALGHMIEEDSTESKFTYNKMCTK